jgi:hypothetical protein
MFIRYCFCFYIRIIFDVQNIQNLSISFAYKSTVISRIPGLLFSITNSVIVTPELAEKRNGMNYSLAFGNLLLR